MTTFADMLLADNAIFLSDFAEQVTYTPKAVSPKAIKAVVDRLGKTRLTETSSEIADVVELTFSTADVPTVTLGGDTVLVSRRIGEVAVTVTVRNIVRQDVGQITVRCS